jgi:glutathione S-transferase
MMPKWSSRIVDLGDETSRAAFLAVWSMGKFPVLGDSGRRITVSESSIVIEYLAQHHPGAAALIPADPDSPCRRGCVIASWTTMSISRCGW